MAYHIDKYDNSIVIDGFDQGIADSPYAGISDMRCTDIISVPGEASVAMSTVAMQTQQPMSYAFTADAGTDVLTILPNNGTDTAVTYSVGNGKILQGAGFNGTTSSIVNLSPFTLDSSTTIACWFKTTQTPAGANPRIFGYRPVAGGNPLFSFNLDNGTGSVSLYCIDSAGNSVQLTADSIVANDGNWHHFVGVKSGNSVFLYVDGVEDASSTGTYTGNFNSMVMGIGRDPSNSEYFLGSVDEVARWNRAITSDEVTQLYNSGTGLTYSSFTSGLAYGVISYYNMQGNSNDIATPPTLEVNTAITVSNSGGALPTGMFVSTAYYVVTVPSATTFTVSSVSAGGATLNITGAGSGINTFTTIQVGTPKNYTSYLWPYFAAFMYFYFLQDSNGRIWVYDSVNLGGSGKWIYTHSTSSEASLDTPNGMIAYKTYLFKFTGTSIDVIRITDTFPNSPTLAHVTTKSSWIFGWNTLSTTSTSTVSNQALVSQNDSRVYICNMQNLATIFEVPGSLPATTSDGSSFNIANTHTKATGVTTNGSKNISTVGSFFQTTDVGAVIVGVGIPTGAIISSVTSSTAAVLSDNATATAAGLTFTITSAYTFDAAILPLPTNEMATCLAELGSNLLIGGINNYIYPWDRVSPNFDAPIFLAENNVVQMVTVNTNTFIFVGERGRIWITNGSQAQMWKKVPDHLSGTVNPFYTWRAATFNRNQLYFGFSVTDNSGTTINQYGGMWAIDVDTKALRLLNKLSYDTYNGYASALYIFRGNTFTSSQTSNGYGMFIGWNSGSVGGVDKGTSTPYTGSQSVVISDLIPIGTFDKPRDFERLEYKLSKPMVTGESVTLYTRLIFNTQDAGFGTAVLTDSTAGNFSKSAPVNFKNAQWIQIKAVTNSTASLPSYTRLVNVRIKSKAL